MIRLAPTGLPTATPTGRRFFLAWVLAVGAPRVGVPTATPTGRRVSREPAYRYAYRGAEQPCTLNERAGADRLGDCGLAPCARGTPALAYRYAYR